jgi:hypothetical protein
MNKSKNKGSSVKFKLDLSMAQKSKLSEAHTLRAPENLDSMNTSKATNSMAVKIRDAKAQ